jgi:hypothetical protein
VEILTNFCWCAHFLRVSKFCFKPLIKSMYTASSKLLLGVARGQTLGAVISCGSIIPAPVERQVQSLDGILICRGNINVWRKIYPSGTSMTISATQTTL